VGRKDSGVFPELADRKAFFDKLIISIWGTRKKRSGPAVRSMGSKAIGGKASKYARAEYGVLAMSGNPYQLRYGPMRLQKILPPLLLVVRSDHDPVTLDETNAAIGALCKKGWKATVSEAEVTFDLKGLSVEFFQRHIFTSARRIRMQRDEYGTPTLYVGGRTSSWEVRVYPKTAELLRFEYIFRRPYLRTHNIRRVSDLKVLCNVDVRRLVWLREVNRSALKSLERSVEDYRRRILIRWSQALPVRKFVRAAKEKFGAVPRELVVESPVEERLRRMQKKLVW
jgi:hypothetical protein